MNHFIFPHIATITLIKMMLARESLIKSLEAQIYGDAGDVKPDKILMKPVGMDDLLKNIRYLLDN